MLTKFFIVLFFALKTQRIECCFEKAGWFNYGLPLVDLREYNASTKLSEALQNWGFSYIVGHQIPKGTIDRATEESKAFFNLPARKKRALAADPATGTKTKRGYTGIKLEQLNKNGKPDLKELLDVGHIDKSISKRQRKEAKHYLGENKWPEELNLQNVTEAYAEHASRVAQTVLSLVAKGLDCEGAFDSVFGPNALQVQRLTRYPPVDEIESRDPEEIGAGVHSDYGGITVLYAEGPGLAVLKPDKSSKALFPGTFSPEMEVPNNNQWVDVDSIPGALIIMAGEALQRLSNGQIYAAKHKVDYAGATSRYSLAFFYDPNPEAILKPLPCFTKKGKPLYKSKIAGHKGVTRNHNK